MGQGLPEGLELQGDSPRTAEGTHPTAPAIEQSGWEALGLSLGMDLV